VFGAPQVAAVGLTEQQCEAQQLPFRVGKRAYGGTAYGWAMEDTTSFAKVIVHAETDQILGAHIMGAHASSLIQPIIQAMRFGQTARQIAEDVIYIHPALSEVVENALLAARP
jgi:mycothione reductase